MVVLGYEHTTQVTMDEMLHHTRAVARARPRALVVGDMPFGSFQASAAEAVKNAVRFVQEGGAEAVKIEGGQRVAENASSIVSAGIPVMGHIGLTPQSIHRMGGYRVQGRDASSRERLLHDARAVQEAGAFALVLEGIPAALAREITAAVEIPSIGIGAGIGCDGQVLVMHDLLGLGLEPPPRFAREYVNMAEIVTRAAKMYAEDVRNQKFPDEHESY